MSKAREIAALGQEVVVGTNGSITVNSEGQDQDFKIESLNQPNMFWLDASTDRVSIGGYAANPYGTKSFIVGYGNADGNTYSNGEEEKSAVILPLDRGVGSAASINFGGASYGTSGTETLRMQFANTHGNSGRAVGWDIVSYVDLDPNTYTQEFKIDRVARASSGNPSRSTQMTMGYGYTIFNDIGSNIDFVVESDTNTNAVTVDASNNSVHIGTATPSCSGFGGNTALQIGDGWQQFNKMYSSGGTRTISFSGSTSYLVEITYTTVANYGSEQIAQKKWIAGRRDSGTFAHLVNSADIIGTAADITYTTSDNGDTRTYTLTLDNGSSGANVFHMVEFKAWGNVGNITF